jgi:hypothetical protein
MTVKEVRKEKIDRLLNTMYAAMIDNYFGGKDIQVSNKVDDECYLYDLRELKFMERANVLDLIRADGWDIYAIVPNPDIGSELDVVWFFKATTPEE